MVQLIPSFFFLLRRHVFRSVRSFVPLKFVLSERPYTYALTKTHRVVSMISKRLCAHTVCAAFPFFTNAVHERAVPQHVFVVGLGNVSVSVTKNSQEGKTVCWHLNFDPPYDLQVCTPATRLCRGAPPGRRCASKTSARPVLALTCRASCLSLFAFF